MSAVAAAGHAITPGDGDRWHTFLTERLDERWRPNEWDPQTLIFTGDPHNQKTFVYLCAHPNCVHPTGGSQHHMLVLPHRSQAAQQNPHAPLSRHHRRTLYGRRRRRPLRTSPRYSTAGLCFTHQSRFAHAAKTRGIGITEFMADAQPLGALATCAVGGAAVTRFSTPSTPLCQSHRSQYRGGRQDRGEPPIDAHEFAAQALPLIRSHEFTLAGCTDLVRAELLWILQERDRRGFGISLLRMRNLVKAAHGARTLFEATASDAHVVSFLRMTLPLLRQQRGAFEGIDLTEPDRCPEVLDRFPPSAAAPAAATSSSTGPPSAAAGYACSARHGPRKPCPPDTST